MFKKMFTEAGKSNRGGPKPSKTAKITDVVKELKGTDIKQIMSWYDELDSGDLSEDVWEFLIISGDYGDYYDDSNKKGLVKKALATFKKALDKLKIDYDIVDCAKSYLTSEFEYIEGKLSDKTWTEYKNKSIGYNEIESYRDAESFVEKFDIAQNCINAMKKMAVPVVCDFSRAGLTKVTYKEIKHKQGLHGHTTSFTEEFEVTVYHYNMKEKVVFNVSKTESTTHQSYWN